MSEDRGFRGCRGPLESEDLCNSQASEDPEGSRIPRIMSTQRFLRIPRIPNPKDCEDPMIQRIPDITRMLRMSRCRGFKDSKDSQC